MSVNYVRGKYVHAAFDKETQSWVYQNLMNRATIRASSHENEIVYSFLNDPNKEPDSSSELALKALLIDRRFLVEADVDELGILQRAFLQNKRNPRFASLSIVTTLQCNLRCEYCYQDHVDETLSALDESAICRLIERLLSAQHNAHDSDRLRSFVMTWWGGEPLLRIDAIERLSARIVPAFSEAGVLYQCYTSTNGVLLSKKNCQILKDCLLKRIQVTIDGPREFHDVQRPNVGGRGTYDSVLTGLHNLIDTFRLDERFVTLRVNVTPRMVDDPKSWLAFFEDIRPASQYLALSIHPAIPNDFYASDKAISNDEFLRALERLKTQARDFGLFCREDVQTPIPGAPYCGAIPNQNWIVLPGGRITKCTDSFHNRSSDCGRLNVDGSMDLFETSKDWLEYSPFDIELCRTCDVLPICMGGCRVIPFKSPNGDRCFRKTTLERSILDHAAKC